MADREPPVLIGLDVSKGCGKHHAARLCRDPRRWHRLAKHSQDSPLDHAVTGPYISNQVQQE
jgi:hypothetical protein